MAPSLCKVQRIHFGQQIQDLTPMDLRATAGMLMKQAVLLQDAVRPQAVTAKAEVVRRSDKASERWWYMIGDLKEKEKLAGIWFGGRAIEKEGLFG